MRTAVSMIVLSLVLASPALGQERSGRGRRAAPPAERPILELEETVIEGEIQRPNAFYILNRTRFGYEVVDMRTSFLPEVVDSVQGDPF